MSLIFNVLGILSRLVAPLLFFFGGRASARADAAGDGLKKASNRRKINARVKRMSDDDLDRVLRGDE